MPVPAKRRSRSKLRRVRAHAALTAKHLVKCPKCGKLKMPHRVCPACGFYQGKEVLKLKLKKSKNKEAKS